MAIGHDVGCLSPDGACLARSKHRSDGGRNCRLPVARLLFLKPRRLRPDPDANKISVTRRLEAKQVNLKAGPCSGQRSALSF